MNIDLLIAQAHTKYPEQLSIMTQLVMPDPDGDIVTVLAQVITNKGEYSAWNSCKLAEGQHPEDVLGGVLESAVVKALQFAGVFPGNILSASVAPLLDTPSSRLSGSAALVDVVDTDWEAVDANPTMYGYEICQGEGEIHAIRPYWSGTALISASKVAELSEERHGKRLCSACTVAAVPSLRRKRK